MHFEGDFYGFLDLIFATFPRARFPRNPCKTLVNTNEIEGRAPGKSAKNSSETDEKTVKNLGRKSEAFFLDFGFILGGFWEHFGSQNAIKNRVKFWMCFWRSKNRKNDPQARKWAPDPATEFCRRPTWVRRGESRASSNWRTGKGRSKRAVPAAGGPAGRGPISKRRSCDGMLPKFIPASPMTECCPISL